MKKILFIGLLAIAAFTGCQEVPLKAPAPITFAWDAAVPPANLTIKKYQLQWRQVDPTTGNLVGGLQHKDSGLATTVKITSGYSSGKTYRVWVMGQLSNGTWTGKSNEVNYKVP